MKGAEYTNQWWQHANCWTTTVWTISQFGNLMTIMCLVMLFSAYIRLGTCAISFKLLALNFLCCF